MRRLCPRPRRDCESPAHPELVEASEWGPRNVAIAADRGIELTIDHRVHALQEDLGLVVCQHFGEYVDEPIDAPRVLAEGAHLLEYGARYRLTAVVQQHGADLERDVEGEAVVDPPHAAPAVTQEVS